MPEKYQPSPKVEALAGGDVEFSFTYDNTILIGFQNAYQEEDPNLDYSHMNNIKHETDDGENWTLYNSSGLYRELARLAFTRIIKPYPDEDDIEDYTEFFTAQMDGEVNRYGIIDSDDDDYFGMEFED